MLNLICMILMTALILGLLIIQLVIYLEGSLPIDGYFFVHLVPMCAVLYLNVYVITLEDFDELVFLRNRQGKVIINISLIISAFIFLLYLFYMYQRY